MSKEKNIQYIYSVISESPEIQDLIIRIVKNDLSASVYNRNDDSQKIKELKSNLELSEAKLHEINEDLKQYKDYYHALKPKADKYDVLLNENDTLKKAVEKYRSDSQSYLSKIRSLEENIGSLEQDKAKLLNELMSAKDTIQTLKKQFEVPVKYFEMYKTLSVSVRRGLENVINDRDQIAFMVSCSCENNLSSIWEYIKDLSANTDSNDFNVLSSIFDYFFDVFNASLSEPKYKRDDVEIGDELDDDYHDRCSGSATSGEIKKIVLKGYRSVNTGKIIHKSLVKA